MRKIIAIILILFIPFTAAFSQELRLVVFDKPLNTVLNTLNVEISFDDKALSKYNVTVSKTFRTAGEAISWLLKDKPFRMEKVGSVYVISPELKSFETDKQSAPPIRKKYHISGELLDSLTGEPLPYAYIQTDKGTVITNESGYFSIVKETNQPTRIQLQYMGFESLDTTLTVGRHKLALSSKVFTMAEVVVQPSSSAMLMQSGKTSGEMRINHQIARYMPGSADNSVFTILRMLPGVRASGEPSEDLFVWGSNWGESRLTYDGFTIFGMKSFNDQIGSVNPYLAKDIRLQKGGYDATSGNRIGAIAEITGNEGDFSKPSVKLNISNYTANIYTSIPIKKTSALSVANRQTFYNLYNKEDVNSSGDHGEQTPTGTYIKPTYDFRDLNIKYAGKAFENDRFHISLYGADDHFKFYVKQQEYEVNATEKNRQYGASTGYNRIWNSGSNSKLLISYSKLDATVDNVTGISNNQATPLDVFNIKNSIQEISAKFEHNFSLGERQKVQIGGQWQNYTSEFNDKQTQINNPSLYITDNILLGKLSLKAGLRTDLVPDKKIHIQPRLSASYSLTDELTATASFGLYNQFLTRIPYQYRQGSYQMIWNLSDSTYLSSTHYLAGLAYSKNGWVFSTEGYVKKNRNQLYFIDNVVSSFDNTVWGVDLYAKKEWKRLTAFGSYSFLNSANPQEYTAHEVKLGAIYTLKSFHFSATYVYGSGFPYLSTSGHGHGQGDEEQQHGNGHQHSDTSNEPPYNRLDLSFTYKLQLKKFKIQTGASVLNVFNTSNVKYSYRLSNQNSAYNVYTKATPFTPVLVFEIIF